MNQLNIALSVSLLVLSSCQSEQTDILARFDKTIPIQATKLNVDTYKLNSFGRMVLFEEQKCIVKENHIGKSLVDIIYYEEDSVREFVKRGNGPDEYVMPYVMQKKDAEIVCIADVAKKVIVKKDLSGNTLEVQKMSESPKSVVYMNNEYITNGVPNKVDEDIKRYSRWNSSGQVLESFGEFPRDNNPSPNKSKLFAYQGKKSVNAVEKRFVSVSSSGAIFELYQAGNGTPSLLKQYHDTYPIYADVSQGNMTGVGYGKET